MMNYENAVKILDAIYLDYIPSAASWLSALEDLQKEHPEALDALACVIEDWKET